MEEVGFEPGELDDILWNSLDRRESLQRRRLKLQIFAAGVHADDMERLREDCPGRPNGLKDSDGNPVDAPLISPSILYEFGKQKIHQAVFAMNEREIGLRIAEIIRKRRLAAGVEHPECAETAQKRPATALGCPNPPTEQPERADCADGLNWAEF